MKTCIKCGSHKPDSGFYLKGRTRRDGSTYTSRQNICRVCENDRARKRYVARNANGTWAATPTRYPQEIARVPGWGWTPKRWPMLVVDEARNIWRKDL